MTQTVDDVLHDLAKRGEISHISLTPNSRGDGWCASFTMCSRFGTSFAEDRDPAQAIIRACTSAKMKPRPAAKKHTDIDAEPETLDWSLPYEEPGGSGGLQPVINAEPEPPVDASDTNDADGGVTIDWSTGKPVEPESFDDLM